LKYKEITKDPLQRDDFDGQLFNRKRKCMIRNGKSKHPEISHPQQTLPIPKPNDNTTSNNENNPNEDVG
jgi:hypothetical protein